MQLIHVYSTFFPNSTQVPFLMKANMHRSSLSFLVIKNQSLQNPHLDVHKVLLIQKERNNDDYSRRFSLSLFFGQDSTNMIIESMIHLTMIIGWSSDRRPAFFLSMYLCVYIEKRDHYVVSKAHLWINPFQMRTNALDHIQSIFSLACQTITFSYVLCRANTFFVTIRMKTIGFFFGPHKILFQICFTRKGGENFWLFMQHQNSPFSISISRKFSIG